MTYFIHILLQNIIPLCVMISIGFILQRIFQLDIRTLSKLNFYLFSPVIIFKMLYESNLSISVFGNVLLFFALYFTLLFVIAETFVRLRRYEGGMKSAMRNSILFYNSANYAIPLNQLVFHQNPVAISYQIIIMMMQSLIPNTYGIYSVNSHKMPVMQTLKTIAGMPVIYAIPLALVLRGFDVPIAQTLYIPINYVADGFIAIALVTLGVQLGSIRFTSRLNDVALSCILRLLVGPVLGFFVVWVLDSWVMEMDRLMAQALVLSCAVPTSLSSVLLAVEFDNEPEFASQAVLVSTIMSIFTVTFVIFWIQSPSFFP